VGILNPARTAGSLITTEVVAQVIKVAQIAAEELSAVIATPCSVMPLIALKH
jgi:hypothetical protein